MSPSELRALLEQIPMAACLIRNERIEVANRHLAKLTGWTVDQLEASPQPFRDFVDPVDAIRLFERNRARVRGEPVADEYDLTLVRPSGERVPSHGRVATFALASPDTYLFLATDERERARTAQAIGGFVDVAVAAQQQDSEEALFRVVREKLLALGLRPSILELRGNLFRILGPEEVLSPPTAALRRHLPEWTPWLLPDYPLPGEQAIVVNDLPGAIDKLLGAVPPEIARNAPPQAVVASIPIAGNIRYALVCSGSGLDPALANAFGLLGKQIGTAIENVLRMEELRRRNRELLAVNEVARAAATLGSGRALHAALEELVGALQLTSVALFRVEADQLRLEGQQGFTSGWTTWTSDRPGDASTPWREAAESGHPVLFQLGDNGRVSASARRVPTPPEGVPALGTGRALETANCIALPLQAGDQVNGVLVAARSQPLSREDLRLLATVAAQVSVSLQNAALLQQTQRRVEELSLLLELGREVVGALDLHLVLHAAARVAARILRCTCAYVMLPDESGAYLSVEALEDPSPQPGVGLGTRMPLHKASLSELAFHTRVPQSSADVRSDERVDPEIAHLFGSRAALVVPLVSHDRSLGVLSMFDRTERSFTPQDLRLASHAGQLVAAALESAELFARERRRADEMALLQDLSRATAGKLETRELLDTALARLLQLLSADVAAVYLVAPEGARLAAMRGRDARLEGLPETIEKPSGEGRFSVVEDICCSRCRVVRDGGPEKVQRSLALPLGDGSALLLGRIGDQAFTSDEVRLATAVCAQLAVSLDNARLYAEQRARAEEMALLVEVGRRLSGSLELRPLLQLGGETVRKLAEGADWVVLLHDVVTGTLRSAAYAQERPEFASIVLPLSEPSTSRKAFEERVPIQVIKPSESTIASRELTRRFGDVVVLAIPLVARDEALGAVVLNRKTPFTASEVERTTAVVQQLAFAVLSARLFEDLRASYAQLARTQEELIDRERLAALGELSASIAHEVRNPLGVIFNSVGSLRRLLHKPQGDVALLLDIIGEEADRLNRMVADLLDYSRPVQPALQPVPLRPLVEEALAAARQQAGDVSDGVRYRISIAPELADVRADARLLRQALFNLFLNALQAMPRGGRLEVKARPADLAGSGAAEITIQDSGAGIPAEVQGRIWQPFFTTKATGTGLGLAVVKRIVEGHRGQIELVPRDAGAEFRIRLPLERDASP